VSILIASAGFGLVTASILALAAVGFTLQFGISNLLNLAYGDTMTAAAFAAYLANRAGAGLWLMLLTGGVFGAVASLALNRLVYTPFRRRGTSLFGMVIVSLSVAVIVQNLLLAGFGPSFFTYQIGQSRTLRAGSLALTVDQVLIIALAVAAMLALHLLLTRSRLGKAMRATSRNPSLALGCGINTSRVVDVAWLLSGFLCGVAGVVLVANTTAFQPTTGNNFLVLVVAAAMLGGVGKPYGAMLGALALGLVTEIVAGFLAPGLKEGFAFAALVIVLLLRPQGLFGDAASRAAAA
jgi:branched-chain amino acid transport system permease protein/neutral amino acid transport system permease protein